MSTAHKSQLTAAEYLAIERSASTKSEFYQGDMFAMAGGSPEHSLISTNFAGEARNQLKDRPCAVFNSDLRVKVVATGLYTYPDSTVVCGPREFDDEQNDTLINPTVLVEVLSPSTEAYDRGVKSRHYRKIDSLTDLVLIAQDSPMIEHYIRMPSGQWEFREYDRLEQAIEFNNLKIVISLEEIYRGVSFKSVNPTAAQSPSSHP